MRYFLAYFLAAVALAQPEDAPTTAPVAAGQPATVPSEPATQPAEPEWTLARGHRPPVAQEDEAFLAWCREKRLGLETKARSAPDSSTAIHFHLAAANLALALEIEPYVSRSILGIERPDDGPRIRSGLDAADTQLKLVADALRTASDTEAEKLAGERETWETLQAFATAFNAIWSGSSAEEIAAARQNSAAELAVHLEADRKDVAAAALMWQAVLYAKLGQPDRVFQLLPEVTARVGREARTFQFHARLLRCRMVADRGGYTAAAALLLQVEEKANEWFTVEADQQAAVHAAMLHRLQVLDRWRTALQSTTQPDESVWCQEAAARLKRDAVAEGNPVFVLGLEKSIPIIAPPPDAPEPLEREDAKPEAPKGQE